MKRNTPEIMLRTDFSVLAMTLIPHVYRSPLLMAMAGAVGDAMNLVMGDEGKVLQGSMEVYKAGFRGPSAMCIEKEVNERMNPLRGRATYSSNLGACQRREAAEAGEWITVETVDGTEGGDVYIFSENSFQEHTRLPVTLRNSESSHTRAVCTVPRKVYLAMSAAMDGTDEERRAAVAQSVSDILRQRVSPPRRTEVVVE